MSNDTERTPDTDKLINLLMYERDKLTVERDMLKAAAREILRARDAWADLPTVEGAIDELRNAIDALSKLVEPVEAAKARWRERGGKVPTDVEEVPAPPCKGDDEP